MESATERVSRHCTMGRMGVVGRYGSLLENPGSAGCCRDKLLIKYRSILGLRYRRLLCHTRENWRVIRPLVSVRFILRFVQSARTKMENYFTGKPGNRSGSPMICPANYWLYRATKQTFRVQRIVQFQKGTMIIARPARRVPYSGLCKKL